MATYQFVIELVPKKWVESVNRSDICKLFDSEIYDVSIAWQDYVLTIDLKSELSCILPENESEHGDMMTWGDDRHNDIKVSLENEKIDFISIRLDVREDIENLKQEIIKLAKDLQCYFFLPVEKKIIRPNIELLDKAIQGSKAAHFVNNPDAYFQEIIEKNK